MSTSPQTWGVNAARSAMFAALAVFAVVAGMFAGPAATANAADDSCADVAVVFARGTFEGPGVGATGHLATSLLAQEAKVTVDHIPYRGAAPALQDIAGGHVDLFFATPQSVLEQVASGQMKAYGITAKETSPRFPTAASFVQELGPKLEILYWHALFAPAGTPDAVVEKLNAALQEIMADPAIVKSWADTGVVPYPKDRRSPAAARALLKSEIARWGQVVRDNNIQAQMQ
jgi:tripartite-type tricarboxylate transporter receptor subunit TctC